MMAGRKKILVVDDEPKIVDVVKSYLEKNGYMVFEAFRGKTAFDLFEQEKPSLIILDWMLPDISGEEIIRILRRTSKVPIIMLTAKAEEENIIKGLSVGADDYITKPFSPRQLVARVEAILRRVESDTLTGKKIVFGDLEFDLDGHTIKKAGETLGLTPNEYKILSCMARYPKKVFTREELINIVSGEDFGGYDRVIDTHIKNIRQKIEDDTKNPQYILTVHGVGYRFGGARHEI